jgi:hypothetical protein
MRYRKRFVTAADYVIEEINGDRTRVVAEEQPDYRAWLEAGNEPEVVEYVELPVNETPLEVVKAQKKSEIAAARYAAEVGGVTVNGMAIDTSRESQALVTGAALAATLDPAYTCRWKTAGGFVTLDAATVLAVAQAVRAHVQACFDREAELAAAIDAAETAEEVQAVSWAI